MVNCRNGDFATKTGIENGFRLTTDDLSSDAFNLHYFSGPYEVPEVLESDAAYSLTIKSMKDRLHGQIEGYYEFREQHAETEK